MNSGAGIAERAEPAMRRFDTHEFRIEDWLVQPARNRMVRGETAVRVRPQLIDVLACLAACPGKVVSKDQLLTEVWSDRFVAESGVARCVAELRQLLADDARQPRIIETISKRGYRLIAPVEWLAPSGPASAVVAEAPAVQAEERRPGRFLRFFVAQRWLATLVTAGGVFLRDSSRLFR